MAGVIQVQVQVQVQVICEDTLKMFLGETVNKIIVPRAVELTIRSKSMRRRNWPSIAHYCFYFELPASF
jgi:hypothetical protein